MPGTIPTGTEPLLPSPLGGPHVLFDGSFIIEFLQPVSELQATVLFRARYVGGHKLMKMGKEHPQAPPLHLHFNQTESFIVESGAIGTTTTYDTIDTIHTPTGNYPQITSSSGLSSSLPSRTSDGTTDIGPWIPHRFWPLSPEHPFWTTPEGHAHEASSPNGKNTDAVMLMWAHPKTTSNPATGSLTTSFPPDMDAAFFLAVLSMVDAANSQRLSMDLKLGATLMEIQTASQSALVMGPGYRWLWGLRWGLPYLVQLVMGWGRRMVDGRGVGRVVEEFIESEVVKRQ